MAGDDGHWQAKVGTSSWRGHTIYLFNRKYLKPFQSLKPAVEKAGSYFRSSHHLGQNLVSAFLNAFENLTVQPLASVNPIVGPSACESPDKTAQPPGPLASPMGMLIAAALNLAGACKLRADSSGKVGFKKSKAQLDDNVVTKVDYYVNLTPTRLALEYVADGKQLPNGYLDRVLKPFYIQKLMNEAGMTGQDAAAMVAQLQEKHGLLVDADVDIEPMMEFRNAIEKEAGSHQRKVAAADSDGGHFPSGSGTREKSVSRKIKKMAVGRLLDQGRATRQEVRDYFTRELRKKGEGREKARELVVAALESRGLGVGKTLTIDDFQAISGMLGLYDESHQGDIVRGYLGLVTHIDKTQASEPGCRKLLLQQAGMKEDDSFEISTGNDDGLTVINPPMLDAPEPSQTYTCDFDELWCIQAKVDRSWKLRLTSDMIKRVKRWISRNKRIIAVEASSRVLTAIVTGLMSSGIGGAMYLACAVVCVPVVLGFHWGVDKVQMLWHRRKIYKYDEAGEPDHASRRKSFYSSLAHVTSEQCMTDCFNAYFNLKEDLEGLEKLKAKANLSAKEQVAYRRYQVMQQLRSAELGEAYKDISRMMMELTMDISRFEQAFEDNFLTLWRPFSKTEQRRAQDAGEPFMSDEEKIEIFNKAAKRLLLKGDVQVALEDRRDWIGHLIKAGKNDTTQSGRLLFRDFGKFKKVSTTGVYTSSVAGRINWLTGNTTEAVKHIAVVVGKFLYTNISMNSSKMLKAGASWLLKGILPRQVDVMPVPTAAIGTYWVSYCLGGKFMQLVNNCRNRLRVKKIIKSRRKPLTEEEKAEQEREAPSHVSKARKIRRKLRDALGTRKEKLGEQVAFDTTVSELGAEDYRALREEGCSQIKQIPRVLKRMRDAHDRLQREVQELTDRDAMVIDREEQLIKTAMLIMERKYLEQQMQELLSGAVGTFYEETLRGEWLRRQEVDDIGAGVPIAAGAA